MKTMTRQATHLAGRRYDRGTKGRAPPATAETAAIGFLLGHRRSSRWKGYTCGYSCALVGPLLLWYRRTERAWVSRYSGYKKNQNQSTSTLGCGAFCGLAPGRFLWGYYTWTGWLPSRCVRPLPVRVDTHRGPLPKLRMIISDRSAVLISASSGCP